ncbi:type II secretion system protein GspM [Patulibacter defluvii]|uniref:type II secretion system protein GspM n=1 Tax=Patulibacter defluvii TaxID=3095358 RepID=UPI002A759338|nr:type II secretion system protein GspM [Patulibacter sp. DM4]
MTEKMRMMLAGVAVLAGGVLLWMVLVTPARDDRDAAQQARDAAEAQATQVQTELTQSRQAAERAPENVRELRRLGVAVPEKVEAAQLIEQLDSTAKRYGVTFEVLKVNDAAASAAPTPAATPDPAVQAADGVAKANASQDQLNATTSTPANGSTTSTTPAPAAGAAASGTAAAPITAGTAPGSVPVSLSVQVGGSYVAVTRFVKSVQGSVRSRGERILAKGRLLRVNSVDLSVGDEQGSRSLSGTLDVVAYLLPAERAPTTPAAATTPTGAQP